VRFWALPRVNRERTKTKNAKTAKSKNQKPKTKKVTKKPTSFSPKKRQNRRCQVAFDFFVAWGVSQRWEFKNTKKALYKNRV
jgi:hypothetical protein